MNQWSPFVVNLFNNWSLFLMSSFLSWSWYLCLNQCSLHLLWRQTIKMCLLLSGEAYWIANFMSIVMTANNLSLKKWWLWRSNVTTKSILVGQHWFRMVKRKRFIKTLQNTKEAYNDKYLNTYTGGLHNKSGVANYFCLARQIGNKFCPSRPVKVTLGQ